MTDTTTAPVVFSFVSHAMADDTFEVTAFSGREEISRPYRYEIELVADTPDIDLENLLLSTAALTLEKGDHQRTIHGILSRCRLGEALPEGRYGYHVVLVPRIRLLSLNRQNQIYQAMTVPQIIDEEIHGTTAKGSTQSAAAGLTANDFSLLVSKEPDRYPQREYTVQYHESDLDFISRLMEHEGIFYFFQQEETGDKIVISDNNVHFPALDPDTIPFRPPSGTARAGDEAILTATLETCRIPKRVVLKDFNYRRPNVVMQGEAEVDSGAHGVVCDYGDHFKTPEEGAKLARIRAEALRCHKQTLSGTSDSVRLAPGYRFRLEEHHSQMVNAEFVVTAVDCQGRQPLAGTAGMSSSEDSKAVYENRLTCIPADVPYRPRRTTPRPRIDGLMNAQVDAAQLDERAEIDKHGRYKLVLPFDLSDAEDGKASRFVRKAQPYGGKQMGMHFPLHKGTEVICDFVNGDPDRPIITGVVPNPETASVVSENSYTKNRIQTASGVLIEVNDGPGKMKDEQ